MTGELLDWKPPESPAFAGETLDSKRDGARLNRQMRRVYDVMKAGAWRTLDQVSEQASAPPASVSARLRDLRKWQFGAFRVERRHVSEGLHEYRVLPSDVPHG